MNDLAIIIVSWNGKKFLKDCFDSLRSQTYKNFKIIFVDNGSIDDSVVFIEKNYPEAEIIKLSKNTGFAYANNLGIQKAFEDENIKYVVTLNNDTKADENYISEMVNCAKGHPEAGSVQPKVINFFDKNIIDSAGILIYKDASAVNRGQNEEDAGQYEKEDEIFGVSASAALYTRKALEKVKLPKENYFDSNYFAYYEDVDLAWRLRLAGFSSFFCSTAKVFHIHSATGKNNLALKKFFIHRNYYYTMIKNLPPFFLITAILFLPVRYGSLIASVLRKKGPAHKLSQNKNGANVALIVLKTIWQVAKELPDLIRKRKIIQKNKTATNAEIKKWLKIYKADFKKMIFGL